METARFTGDSSVAILSVYQNGLGAGVAIYQLHRAMSAGQSLRPALARHDSALRGCIGLAALATTRISHRGTPGNLEQTLSLTTREPLNFFPIGFDTCRVDG